MGGYIRKVMYIRQSCACFLKKSSKDMVAKEVRRDHLGLDATFPVCSIHVWTPGEASIVDWVGDIVPCTVVLGFVSFCHQRYFRKHCLSSSMTFLVVTRPSEL